MLTFDQLQLLPDRAELAVRIMREQGLDKLNNDLNGES